MTLTLIIIGLLAGFSRSADRRGAAILSQPAPSGQPASAWASKFPVAEPVVDADAECVRSKAIVNAVKGDTGERCARHLCTRAGRGGIGPLAETHMEILRRNRPRAVQSVFDTAAGRPPGGCKGFTSAKRGGGNFFSRRSVAERAVVRAVGDGGTAR